MMRLRAARMKDEKEQLLALIHPSSFRRGAGVAELAALEMLCTGNCTVGSNPTLSAIWIAPDALRAA
jgi:hypothetical protein